MRRKKEYGRRRIAALLAVTFFLSGAEGIVGVPSALAWQRPENGRIQAMPQTAEAPGEEETGVEKIVLRSVEDFLKLSQNCTRESYSKGKQFVLEADLDLQGSGFLPIGVFAGTFDGNGHEIKGLQLSLAGSNLGLFRYIQEGAVVKNLSVYGDITPDGSRTNIGGIAGVNRGRIENCKFAGQITAQEALGGIAGVNEETGEILRCENRAMLTGNIKTGGIAGVNEGSIVTCVNHGDVNASDQGVSEKSENQVALGEIDFEERIRIERVNDAGGIAGYSSGTVKSCINQGTVGYPHIGYNLGGIVGRQCGIVEKCINKGDIQGRKDVGGIAGQFEPYLTVIYEEDMLDSLQSQMDALSDMGDALSRMIENAGDRATDDLDQVDSQLGKIRDTGRSYKDVYREDGDQIDREIDPAVDDILQTLEDMDLDLVDQGSETHYRSAMEQARKISDLRREAKKGYEGQITDVKALREWLARKRQILEEMAGLAQELEQNLVYLAVNVPRDAVDGIEGFEGDFEDLLEESRTLIRAVRRNMDQLRDDLDHMDEDLTADVDVLSQDMDQFTDGLKDSKNQIRAQKNQIEDQISQIQDTISDGIDRAKEDKELFEDVSDLISQELEPGMIRSSQNRGKILADYQAGGIVGIIGMETSLDPEQDLEAEEERTLNVTRNIRAIVFECINRESVEVKNDYAGGIVGKANLGALIQNQNYGDIMAVDGNYAGGITGSSAYILRKNYNKCRITGNDYIGGIAGWGTDILENYSMVTFASMDGEWIGSIAGDTDEEGIMENNVYVEEGIGALDKITYEGQAEGLPYEEFLRLPQMPAEFGQMTVEFLVDDQVVKTIHCNYGGAVPDSQIPKVPQKDGYYYVWEEKDLSCIRGNEKVHAIYKAWNTTIASSADKMPALLAEGNFYPGTTLELNGSDKALADGESSPSGYQVIKGYGYKIHQPDGVADPEQITLHVLAEDCPKDAGIGIWQDGSIQLADSKRDGAYLVFTMDGPGEFVIVRPERRIVLWLAFGAGVLILILGSAAAKNKKKRPKKTAGTKAGRKEEQKTENEEETEAKEKENQEVDEGEPEITGETYES